VTTTVTPTAETWWYSIDTVSLSEDGFERTHQGSCLAFTWPLRLAPGERLTVTMSSAVSVDRDLAEEEGL
jgi:alpha-amylase